MKANELRIGNLIKRIATGDITEVLEVLTTKIGCVNPILNNTKQSNSKLTNFEPILLTPEWLIKFGFEFLNKEYSLWSKNKWQITQTRNEYFKNSGMQDRDDFWRLFISNGKSHEDFPKFKYVHELQNLYFALTGKELTYNNEHGR